MRRVCGIAARVSRSSRGSPVTRSQPPSLARAAAPRPPRASRRAASPGRRTRPPRSPPAARAPGSLPKDGAPSTISARSPSCDGQLELVAVDRRAARRPRSAARRPPSAFSPRRTASARYGGGSWRSSAVGERRQRLVGVLASSTTSVPSGSATNARCPPSSSRLGGDDRVPLARPGDAVDARPRPSAGRCRAAALVGREPALAREPLVQRLAPPEAQAHAGSISP